MPSISGPSITSAAASAAWRAASVSSSMNSVMPCTSAWREALVDRPVAPGEIAAPWSASPCRGIFPRARAAARTAPGSRLRIDVLARLAQLGIDVVIDGHLAGIDDAHVHAGLDGVIQEHRMHGLAHRLVAAERERQVRDAARDMRVRQVLADPARRLDEVDAVIVVLLDAGRDRKDIRIEDDVLRREIELARRGCRRRACRSRSCARRCRPGRSRRTPSPRRRRRGAARSSPRG